MTEQKSTFVVDLHGRDVTFTYPTSGQVESMVRIATSLNVDDEEGSGYWIRHIQRLNRLLNALIDPADHDYVDDLYDTGKISSSELLKIILDAQPGNQPKAPKNGPVKKAAVKRVRRS